MTSFHPRNGFRKCLEQNGIKLRWNFDNKASYDESCEHYLNYYDPLYSPFLPEEKNVNILDVGCGFGWLLYYFCKKGYKNSEGIDIDSYKLGVVKKYGTQRVKDIDAFEFLKDKTNYYDLIVLTYVLEHIPKEKMFEFLALVYTSLKIGGKIIVTVPNMESPLNLKLRYVDFTHESCFTVSSLLYVMHQANFNCLKIQEEFVTPKDPKVLKKYNNAVHFLSKLYTDMCVQAPFYFSEGLMCIGTK